MRWLVADSLYFHEAFFCSHLDSYSHYLREFGETVYTGVCHRGPIEVTDKKALEPFDVVFALDEYGLGPAVTDTRVRIAQVAAICNPMPWEVRKPDGSPAYDCVISSLRWMVEEARKAGCRAEYMPLAFDTRARVCGMGVTRDLGCIFVGTLGPNHKRRTEIVGKLQAEGLVTVFPPTFGREMFRVLARAKVVLNIHAEWARGEINNMRCFEGVGMGCHVITDGTVNDSLPVWPARLDTIADARAWVSDSLKESHDMDNEGADAHLANLMRNHTYESRIPRLIEIARECMEAKR